MVLIGAVFGVAGLFALGRFESVRQPPAANARSRYGRWRTGGRRRHLVRPVERRGPLRRVWHAFGRLDEQGSLVVRPVEINQICWDEVISVVGRELPAFSLAWAVQKNDQWFVWQHLIDGNRGPIQGLADPMLDRAACVQQRSRLTAGTRISGAPIIKPSGRRTIGGGILRAGQGKFAPVIDSGSRAVHPPTKWRRSIVWVFGDLTSNQTLSAFSGSSSRHEIHFEECPPAPTPWVRSTLDFAASS